MADSRRCERIATPENGDEDGTSTIPGQGTWCWLLAPDGSHAILPSFFENGTTANESIPPIDATRRTPNDDSSPDHERSDEEGERNSISGHSWCWLLAPDGSYATLDTTVEGRVASVLDDTTVESGNMSDLEASHDERKSDPIVESGETSDLEASNDERKSDPIVEGGDTSDREASNDERKSDPIEESGNISDLEASNDERKSDPTVEGGEKSDPIVEGGDTSDLEASDDERKIDPIAEGGETSDREASVTERKRGRWYWLLAPDGSHATLDTTVEGGEMSTIDRTVEGGTSEAERCSPATAETSDEERERKPIQGRWHWLLAPDGTPATVNNSTSTPSRRVATAGKRKRGDLPDGKQLASRPQRSSRSRRDCEGPEPIETDDEDRISTAMDDGDDIDDARRSTYNSKIFNVRWEERFQLLVEYKNKHKMTNVLPVGHPILENWSRDQRVQYRKKILTKCRRQRLESIGFVFDVQMAKWMDMYNQLLSHKEQHDGSVKVPLINCRSNKNNNLASWVRFQRKTYNRKKLSEEKIALLESIDFKWRLFERKFDSNVWMVMYRRLLAYKEKYKNIRVPQKFEADPQLAKWVCLQRHRCKEEDRMDLLDDIGFEWNPNEDDWMVMYQRLLVHQKKYKSIRFPPTFKSDPQLGTWVRLQRKSCIQKDRVDLLNGIGFVWNALLEDNWTEMYQRLLAYHKKYKNTRVPRNFEADPQLAKWVKSQHQFCIQKDRVDLLNDIGFVWNGRDKRLGR